MIHERRIRGSSAYAAGIAAEKSAERLFVNEGYVILERRKRTPYGEIDLIVADTERLVFVEVKQRSSIEKAAYSVSQIQQSRLLRSGAYLLDMNNRWMRDETRFDAILIARSGDTLWLRDVIRVTD